MNDLNWRKNASSVYGVVVRSSIVFGKSLNLKELFFSNILWARLGFEIFPKLSLKVIKNPYYAEQDQTLF